MPANIKHHTLAPVGETTIPKASYNEPHDHTFFPDALSDFTPQTDVVTGSTATSETISLAGETDLVWPITVRGDGTPTLQLNEAGDWLTHANAISGDTVRIRLTASPLITTERIATLYVPGSKAELSVTTAAAWIPSDLGSSLRAWFPIHTLGLANDDSIATLTDSSGLSHDLTNATSGERPTYKTSVLNGLAVAQFDGGDRMFRSSFAIGSGTGLAFGAVYKLTADGVYPMVVVYKSNTGWEMRHVNATRQPNFILDAGASSLTASSIASDTWLIRIDVFDSVGDTAKMFINGTQVDSAGSVTLAPPTSTENLYVGGRSDGYGMTGQIADAAVCNALSVSDRQKLEGYWAHLYNLTSLLPGDHPYKTVPP